MQYKNLTKNWAPVIVYLALIYYLSSLQYPVETLSQRTGIKFFTLSQYIYHIIEYAILSFLFWRALKNSYSKYPQIYTILFSIFYAFTDEFHQSFVPTRTASIIDVLFDTLGILALQSIITIVYYIKERTRHKLSVKNLKI